MLRLNPLSKIAYRTANANGFYDYSKIPYDVQVILTKLLLINGEVAEATEAIRRDQGTERVQEELADIMIRTLDLMGYMNMDVDKIVDEKMEYNSTRPYKHGRLF